ncbi:hypothetical protein ACH9DO_04295 [Kocuria sp. M1N1S27]|uniref:hypothetical protein n=1 Tax=Kocuria kalidii TaxID=3376283 RepID=UPI0037A5C4C3
MAREQARQLRQAIRRAGIAREQLWLHYFSLGGEAGETEVDAYLHQSFSLPPFQRDLLAHAANELIARIPPPQAPYASDLVDGDNADDDNLGAQ